MIEFLRNNWVIGVIGVILLVVVDYIWLLVFYRGGLRRRMAVALAEGNWQKYERLLHSIGSRLLLRDGSTSLARANSLLTRGDAAGCRKALRRVNPGTLDFEQKLGYFRVCSMLAINDRDLELYDKIRAELEETGDEEHQSEIEDLKRGNELNRKLYFEFDPSVIKDLEARLKESKGQGKGLVYMSLARAYHMNGDEKLALSSLKSARNLLKGTPYEEMIQAMMENTGLID